MRPANRFAGSYVDRRAEEREREDWWLLARADEATQYVVMSGTRVLTRANDDGHPTVQFLRGADPRIVDLPPARQVLLGWFEHRRCVLVQGDDALDLLGSESWGELRPVASSLSDNDAGLLAYARALAIWRATHRYCARCGGPLEPARAGHVLHCAACGHNSFPRIDPAIIVLVTDGERALLGRQASWVPGRYSTIAGFVEPGEALEDAVQREVREEASIEIQDVRYHSSQPWPFPSSLMVGFEAIAAGGEPRAHDGELEDVRWFERHEVASGAITLPPPESISRRLIESWLGGAR